MIKTIYKIQWRIQTFREGGVWGGGGGVWAVIKTVIKGGASVCYKNKARGPPPPSCPSPGSATEIIYNPVKLREF